MTIEPDDSSQMLPNPEDPEVPFEHEVRLAMVLVAGCALFALAAHSLVMWVVGWLA